MHIKNINKILIKQIFLLVAFLVMGWIIYQPSFHAPFQLDDKTMISSIPLLQGVDDLLAIWVFDPSRYLTHFTFAMNYNYGFLNPFIYHVFNFTIHIAVCLIYYSFLKLIFQQCRALWLIKIRHEPLVIMFSTFLFLCHPLQTSAVSYAIQRSTLLAAFFYVLTLTLYLFARQKNNKLYYFVSIATAAIGLFTKPIIITLPLAITLVEFYFFRPVRKKRVQAVLRLIPFFALALTVPLLLTLWKYQSLNLGQVMSMTRETTQFTRLEYFFTQLEVLATYVKLYFVPHPLILDYDLPLANFVDPKTIISLLILILLIILGVKFYSSHRILSFSIFWFFITLSLESTIFPISDLIFEHRLYLPLMGCSLIYPLVFDHWIKSRRLFIIILTVIIGVLSYLSFQRNLMWADSVKFQEHEVKYSPLKPRVWLNLGLAYLNDHQLDDAEKSFEHVLLLSPLDMKAYHNLAVVGLLQKDYQKALVNINKAIELDPKFGASYGVRGNIYQELNNYELAIVDYSVAIEHQANNAEAFNNRGLLFSRLHQDELAISDFTQAINIRKDFLESYRNRGNSLTMIGNYPLALLDFDKALEMDPSDAQTFNSKGVYFIFTKEMNAALDHFSQAIELNPKYVDAYFNRGKLYFEIQKFPESIRDFSTVLMLMPNHAQAYYQRAISYWAQGENKRAAADLSKAKALGIPINKDFFKSLEENEE